jgi:hypothetical protein
MGVNIKIRGVSGSEEFLAAQTLKLVFERDLSVKAAGSIDICTNLKLIGQKTKDVDMLVIGKLQGESMRLEIPQESNFKDCEVSIQSFFFVIEVKNHDLTNTSLAGNRILVKYSNKWSDATNQAFDEMNALRGFLEPRFAGEKIPYICNFVWLRNITRKAISSINSGIMANAGTTLPSEFTAKFLFQKACYQQFVSQYGNRCFLNALNKQAEESSLDQRILKTLAAEMPIPSEMTRKRVERISKSLLSEDIELKSAMGSKLVVFAGRAGTGKTVRMLRAARELAVDSYRRCLFLTFNRALVQDLRRLLFLANIPDAPDHCVKVLTTYEFVRSVADAFGILRAGSDLLNADEFQAMCEEIACLVRGNAITEEDIQNLAKKSPDILSWDHIFVDEAQDSTEAEKQLLFSLFNYNKIAISDGVDQFLRGLNPCDWTKNVFVTKKTEKRSLRQKRNLAFFANAYAGHADLNWSVEPVDEMTGGKVIISPSLYPVDVLLKARKEALDAGNDPYDILFLVPPALVDKSNGFRGANDFGKVGLKIWDGTNKTTFRGGPVDLDHHRMLQYASCRGLEAWTVVCVGFDEYIRHTRMMTSDEVETEIDQFATPEAILARTVGLKTLIPLTRAIDTLVITCVDWASPEALGIKRLAESSPDVVEIIHSV